MAHRIKDLVNKAKVALANAQDNRKLVEQNIKACSNDLRRMRQCFKRAQHIGQKQSYISCINLIESYRNQIKRLKSSSGTRYSRINWASKRISWGDMESAFDDRYDKVLNNIVRHYSYKGAYF